MSSQNPDDVQMVKEMNDTNQFKHCPGMCSFSWNFAQFYWASDFVEFMLGSFSCFYIDIAYSNFTFCGAWTPSLFACRWKLSKFQENEHIPGNFDIRGISSKCYLKRRNLQPDTPLFTPV